MTVLFSFTIHWKFSVNWKGNKVENMFMYEPRARWEVYADSIHHSTVYRICTRRIHENFIDRKVTTQRIFVFMLWLWGYCWPRWCGRKWILNEKNRKHAELMFAETCLKCAGMHSQFYQNIILRRRAPVEVYTRMSAFATNCSLVFDMVKLVPSSSCENAAAQEYIQIHFGLSVTVSLLPSKKVFVFYLHFRFQLPAVCGAYIIAKRFYVRFI